MKNLKVFLYESLEKKYDFNDRDFRIVFNEYVNTLDPVDSIAGLNCWDVAWSFGEYATEKFKLDKEPECVIFGDDEHYASVITIDGKSYIIDFTVANQHHFNNACVPYKHGMFTKDKLKEEKLILSKNIPNEVKNIELESPKDLFDDFDDIFEIVTAKTYNTDEILNKKLSGRPT